MLEPDSQDSGWLEKGRLALQCLNTIDAYEYFVQALNLDPNSPEAWLQYGSVLEKLGCYGDAIAANNNAQKLYTNPTLKLAPPSLEPTPAILSAIVAKQRSADYWLQQGYALGDLRHYEDAVLSFEKAIALDPNRQEAWFSRSNALAAAGRFQESIVSYQKAAELNPQDYQTWNNFGYVWHQIGDYEQAIAHYDEAIACKPDCAPAWNNRGFALFHLGLYDTALVCYDTALSFNKNYAAAWHNRGNALRALERYEEAISNFDQALAIQPDFQDVKTSRNLALRAMGAEEIQEETSLESNLAFADFQEIYGEILEPQPEDMAIEDNQIAQIAAEPQSDLTRPKLELAKSDLAEKEDFKVLQETAIQLLEDLQNPKATPAAKSILKRQLAESYQRQVDLLAQHNPTKALELAEECKDRWIGSLRDGWNYQPLRPTYAQMQTLLSPRTAALYWHLSPDTLTTFILKQNHPPQVFQSVAFNASLDKNAALAASQHQELENWLTEWTEDYCNYRNQDLLPTATAPWREQMEAMLFSRLRSILEIERLCLEDLQDIDQLILIPHRDLHLIPLHVLFPEQYTVTYLPSAQIGLGLPPTTAPQRLLSIEDPATQWDKPKDVSSSILFTQLEAALVTRLYGSFRTQSITREAATKAKVLDALSLMSGCFYFSGYSHQSDESAQPALALAGQDWLTSQDLYSIGLHNYSLVCLSIDEAETPHVQTIADETADLVSGLLTAGAAHVLSTLWKVNGISSVLMMTEFHRKLFLEDLPPAQALAQTQQWLRTVTYAELSQWYQSRADELTAIDSHNLLGERLQDFARKAQAKADESELLQYVQTPYTHPYYWAGLKIAGNAS
jgi:tetratricopeptide (TPR) repeat protein/CHAT domain-containing protein